jgi:hypothetical protein
MVTREITGRTAAKCTRRLGADYTDDDGRRAGARAMRVGADALHVPMGYGLWL